MIGSDSVRRSFRVRRVIAVIVAMAAVACVSTSSGGDPFSGSGPRAPRSGTAAVTVSFEGACDICTVVVDVGGTQEAFQDTALIRRRYRVDPTFNPSVSMTASPLRGPVEWIAIRVDGETLAEAATEGPQDVTGARPAASGALAVQATIEVDRQQTVDPREASRSDSGR